MEPSRYVPKLEIHAGLECVEPNLDLVNNWFTPSVSCFTRLKNAVALCFRFVHNCRNKNRQIGVINSDELKHAEIAIIKMIQNESYDKVKNVLRKNHSLKTIRSNTLLSLSPFLDNDDIIRVGGRLKNADVPFEAKHQILLPARHPVTALIIKNIHEKCMHGGAKLTEATLRQKSWVTQSQRTIKSVLKKCVRCFRANPKSQ